MLLLLKKRMYVCVVLKIRTYFYFDIWYGSYNKFSWERNMIFTWDKHIDDFASMSIHEICFFVTINLHIDGLLKWHDTSVCNDRLSFHQLSMKEPTYTCLIELNPLIIHKWTYYYNTHQKNHDLLIFMTISSQISLQFAFHFVLAYLEYKV